MRKNVSGERAVDFRSRRGKVRSIHFGPNVAAGGNIGIVHFLSIKPGIRHNDSMVRGQRGIAGP